jgi:hypothetical protein
LANGFLEFVEVRPRADRGLQFTAVVTGPSALLSWWVADVAATPWPLGVALPALAAAALLHLLLVRRRRQPTRALLLPDGSWRLSGADGEPVPARLHSAWGRAGGPVIALEWVCADGARRSAWLLRRDVPGPGWRRLRARLRIA